ncbi:MAG: hypothetical protein A4E39_00409 [Methanoregulaceae archaeon PtaB.Bin152]|nr:MAG: hypothetical protein A4E39_00409 [Methanoregulaceae archaeon PtaB.Bin152]
MVGAVEPEERAGVMNRKNSVVNCAKENTCDSITSLHFCSRERPPMNNFKGLKKKKNF